MSYTVPTFNIGFSYWRNGVSVFLPPSKVGICQMYTLSRTSTDIDPGSPYDFFPTITIRIPVSFLLGFPPPFVGGIFKLPGSGGFDHYYKVRFWESYHRGFSNEYVGFIVAQCNAAGLSPDPGR